MSQWDNIEVISEDAEAILDKYMDDGLLTSFDAWDKDDLYEFLMNVTEAAIIRGYNPETLKFE